MLRSGFHVLWAASVLGALAGLPLFGEEPPTTGPQTEKRFPPLRVPDGFKATLFACDPLIEYPSVIAVGPKPGSLFVAVDYLTGLGTDIVRRDEIRLVEDTDSDGCADRTTVLASGFNSIQGLAYHDGTVYVMHAPHLTAVPATRRSSDERRDLLTGLGLPPEKDPIRLHNANGVVVGHDGWLYLALGDRGCDVKRPEGDRLILEGGGILRCRPDGRDAHVFATGLRNIYDVALDEELNVFVRDNENDGGDYKIRVCHSFFGADHGYPYLYSERPDEALRPLADLGLGSSAGGVCYLEQQFPVEYRGSLLFCEWGRAVIRYPLKRTGASFAPPREADFASGAATDPYGFKPTDLVVDHDGSLLVADWADGQRPRRGRGRIYRIQYVGKREEAQPTPKDDLARLDSESYAERWRAQEALKDRGKEVAAALKEGRLGERGRLHAVWILAKADGAADKLLALAEADSSPRVQAQAVRALADVADPILVRHRLDAGPGDAALAGRIANLAVGRAPQVQLEALVALGRLRWRDTPAWLRKNLKQPEPALAHAAQWALRRADNVPAVLKLLDEPPSEPTRTIALRAVAGQYDSAIVDGLIERLTNERDAGRRREHADALTRVWRKPAPWTYWGFRPPPRPANTVAWERSDAIETALDRVLTRAEGEERLALLRRMLRENVPAKPDTLGRWLKAERNADTVAGLLAALRDRPASETRPHLEAVLADRRHTLANRLLAASLFLRGLDANSEERLLTVASGVEDGVVLAELLRAAGPMKLQLMKPLLLRKLASDDAAVRAGALGSLIEVDAAEARGPVGKLLDDPDGRVRATAARGAGRLGLRSAADRLLKLARGTNAEARRASFEALRQLREPRVVPLAAAALRDRETAVVGLECLGELSGPKYADAVVELVRNQPSAEVLAAAGKALTAWATKAGVSAAERQQAEQTLAAVHGDSGVVVAWHVRGPLRGSTADDLVASLTRAGKEQSPADWRIVHASGLDGRARLGQGVDSADVWLLYAEVAVRDPVKVEFFTAPTAEAIVWLNGTVAHRWGTVNPPPDHFEAGLVRGRNRVLVRLTGPKGVAEFQLRFRRTSATADHERLTRAALSRPGNPERGRVLFENAEKSLCIRCHRVGERGERVGPDLTGLGGRFAKAYIVESILEPGRSVAPSFESTVVELKNGKVVAGVMIAESETSLTLVDNQTTKHVLPRSAITGQTRQADSAMPDGLEKRLAENEFVDLVSYLCSLKDPAR